MIKNIKNKKKLDTMGCLRKNTAILKPVKGISIVIVSRNNYKSSTEKIFSHKHNFKVANEDPTFKYSVPLQSYLKKLLKKSETTDKNYKKL